MNKIEIKKIDENENIFQLVIEDNKISTTAELTLDDLLSLREKIQDEIKSVKFKTYTIWNPRSKRHEIIREEDTENDFS
jgi:hypothetical protein